MEFSHYLLILPLLAVIALILYRTWTGVLIHYSISILNPTDIWPELLSPFRLSFTVAAVTLLSFLISGFRNELTVNNYRYYVPFALLVIGCLINLSHAVSDIDSQWVYLSTHTPDEFMAYFNKALLFYTLALFCISNWSQVEWLLTTLLGIVVVYAIWTNFQYVENYTAASTASVRIGGALGGFLEDENSLAALLVAGIAPAFYIAKNHQYFAIRILSFIALITIIHAIYLTGSRGGLLALVAVVAFIALTLKNRKHRLLLIVLFSLTVPLFGNTVMDRLDRTADNYNNSEENIDPRLSIWTMGIEIVKSNPWLGIGPSRFQTEVSKYPLRVDSPVGSCEANTPCVVHNTLLQFSTSGGVFAGVLYVLLLLFIMIPSLFTQIAHAAKLLIFKAPKNLTSGFVSNVWKAVKHTKSHRISAADESDFRHYSGDAIRASILGISICGIFLDLMLFDAFYFLVMLFVVRYGLVTRESKLLSKIRKIRKLRKGKRKSNKWGYSPAAV